jgi:RNA polymerase sigma factor (sigma-70 family)
MYDFKMLLTTKALYPEGTYPIEFWPSMDYVIDEALTTEELVDLRALRKAFEGVFNTLSIREEKVLRDYYGIGREKKTLQEIAWEMYVSRSRAGQIRTRALQKLNRPERRVRLEPFVDIRN